MELLSRVLQQPWGPLLVLGALQILVFLALLPWAFKQDRRRMAAWQAWLESLPGPLREAHRRSKPRVVAARAVDLLEFFTTLGVGVVIALLVLRRKPQTLDENLLLALVLVPFVTAAFLFPLWLLVHSGRTLGQALLGLSTRRLDGRALDWDTVWKLRKFDGPARANALTLPDEEWDRLHRSGVWPVASTQSWGRSP